MTRCLKCSAHHVALHSIEGIVDGGSHQASQHETNRTNQKVKTRRTSTIGHPFSKSAVVEEELTIKECGADHQRRCSIEFQPCWCCPGSMMHRSVNPLGDLPLLQPGFLPGPPSGDVNSLKMAIEMADLPIKNGDVP